MHDNAEYDAKVHMRYSSLLISGPDARDANPLHERVVLESRHQPDGSPGLPLSCSWAPTPVRSATTCILAFLAGVPQNLSLLAHARLCLANDAATHAGQHTAEPGPPGPNCLGSSAPTSLTGTKQCANQSALLDWPHLLGCLGCRRGTVHYGAAPTDSLRVPLRTDFAGLTSCAVPLSLLLPSICTILELASPSG